MFLYCFVGSEEEQNFYIFLHSPCIISDNLTQEQLNLVLTSRVMFYIAAAMLSKIKNSCSYTLSLTSKIFLVNLNQIQ